MQSSGLSTLLLLLVIFDSAVAVTTCVNGGTMVHSHPTCDCAHAFSCNCINGTFGSECQNGNPNECASSPCMNGGTCMNLFDAFSCVCSADFSGPLCATHTVTGPSTFKISGYSTRSNIGYSLTYTNDSNGDSMDDLFLQNFVSGAPGSESASHFVFGTATVPGSPLQVDTDLDGTNGAALSYNVAPPSSGFAGLATSIGDYNGDGYEDTLICETTVTVRGRCYVYFGKPGPWDASTTIPTDLDVATATQLVNGSGLTSGSVGYVTAGHCDINGDGKLDILLGGAIDNALALFVLYGRDYVAHTTLEARYTREELIDGVNGFAFVGANGGEFIVTSAVECVGDVNGDGFDDVMGLTPDNMVSGVLTTFSYLLYGAAQFDSRTRVNATTSVKFSGRQSDFFGIHFGDSPNIGRIGDVNGDGLADLAFTARGADTSAGKDAGILAIVYGQAAFAATYSFVHSYSLLDGVFGIQVQGPAAFSMAGNGFGRLGRYNDDEIDDFVVSTNSSGIYVVFGSESFPANVSLASIDGHSNGYFIDTPRSSLASFPREIGDFDGNGRNDIAIGLYQYPLAFSDNPPVDGNEEGIIYVLLA